MRGLIDKQLLILLTLVYVILCSSVAYAEETIRGSSMVEMDVFEDYDSSYSTYNTIKLDGEYISLPCKVSVLNNLGFDFRDNEDIEPYSFDNMNYMYNKRGDRIMVDVLNTSKSTKTLKDGIVVEISYDYQEGSTLEFEYNGITFESKIEDCDKAIGRPTYVSDVYDGVYTASYKSSKGERTTMLSFFKDDTLIGFSIECDRPLDMAVNGYHPSGRNDYSYDYDYDYNYSTEKPSESFSITVIIIAVLTVFVFPIVIIVFIVILVMRHIRKSKEEKYEAEVRKAREVRRVLQTPIEDIDMGLVDDENDDLKDKWLN